MLIANDRYGRLYVLRAIIPLKAQSYEPRIRQEIRGPVVLLRKFWEFLQDL